MPEDSSIDVYGPHDLGIDEAHHLVGSVYRFAPEEKQAGPKPGDTEFVAIVKFPSVEDLVRDETRNSAVARLRARTADRLLVEIGLAEELSPTALEAALDLSERAGIDEVAIRVERTD